MKKELAEALRALQVRDEEQDRERGEPERQDRRDRAEQHRGPRQSEEHEQRRDQDRPGRHRLGPEVERDERAPRLRVRDVVDGAGGGGRGEDGEVAADSVLERGAGAAVGGRPRPIRPGRIAGREHVEQAGQEGVARPEPVDDLHLALAVLVYLRAPRGVLGDDGRAYPVAPHAQLGA